MARVVVVTGVSRHLGGRLARALAVRDDVDRVIGVDVIPPPTSIGGAEFVRADIRNPTIVKLLSQSGVDTVVHMNVIATPTFAGGRTTQKEINVIGTMQLLAACQKARSVQRLVVKSSAAVYGSGPRDPAMFTEDMTAKSTPRSGFGKDSIEVEAYVRGFQRRRPDAHVLMLRFANVIGPSIRTSLTDYFSLPVLPVPLGFDARMQFVHEDDAVAALLRATLGEDVGITNIAGDGVVTLSQAAAIAGRLTVPVPRFIAGPLGGLVRQASWGDFSPDQLSFLTYGRGMDTTRMRSRFGFEPTWTTRGAFESFAHSLRPGLPLGHVVSGVLGDVVEARGTAPTRPDEMARTR